MAFSQYFATQVLSWVKGSPFPTALTNVYVSLHSSDPGTAGTAGDVTQNITNSSNRTSISSSALSAVAGASGGGFEITNYRCCSDHHQCCKQQHLVRLL